MKLYIVVNVDWFFLSHRLPIALAAKNVGWDVTIVTADTGRLKDIEAAGLKVVNLPMSRAGMNIWQELKTFWFLCRLYTREKVDVVHHVGLKTILWGTLAAKFAHVHGVVNAISGLGVLFAEENDSVIKKVLPSVLRFAHHRDHLLAIFQNQEDKRLYIENGIIHENQARFIKGSGIDLNEFCYTPAPEAGKIIVLLTCRIIRKKGVFILTEAAEMLRGEYEEKVEFWIAGGLDDHPDAITKAEMDAVCDGHYIKWLGKRDDVKDLLQQCHIFAFPSYYMEGLPKSLIEACAVGRPIVTTDNNGCRDVVTDGLNGFIVPVKDAMALADKMKVLIEDPALRSVMGRAAREKAEREFSIEGVVEKHLGIYEEIAGLCPQ